MSESRLKRRKAESPPPAPKGVQYHCDYCRRDITQLVRIKCAQCANFDLCVECFSQGAEVTGVINHKKNHSYHVTATSTEPIFEKNWGADEELLLLEAVELYGFGNWSDIADHVGNNKTKEKAEKHFVEVYLGTGTELPKCRKGNEDGALLEEKMEVEKVVETKAAYPLPTVQGVGNQVGYLPYRDEFEVVWNNDFEQILADMEFRADDTPHERDLKLKMLEIYHRKLDKREEMQQFILKYGLLFPKEKKRSKEEREVAASLKPFLRFHSLEQHEQLISVMAEEARLRKRIETLQTYRSLGIKTLAEAEKYENDIKKNPYRIAEKKGKVRTMGITEACSNFNLGPEEVNLLPQERSMCLELKIPAKDYFRLKEIIISQYAAKKPEQLSIPIVIDIERKQKVVDFFIKWGWTTKEEIVKDLEK